MSSLGEGQKLRLVADAGKSVAAVTLRYADNTSCYNQIEIEAKPGSDVTVLMTYISTAQAKGQASVQTKIDVAAGAKVKLVQVQLLGRDFLHINDVGSELGDNAAFELLQIQLGADKSTTAHARSFLVKAVISRLRLATTAAMDRLWT